MSNGLNLDTMRAGLSPQNEAIRLDSVAMFAVRVDERQIVPSQRNARSDHDRVC